MTQKPGGLISPHTIIGASSVAMAALGIFLAMSKDTTDELRELDRRVTRIETSVTEGRQRHDEQARDLAARIQRIEDRRR